MNTKRANKTEQTHLVDGLLFLLLLLLLSIAVAAERESSGDGYDDNGHRNDDSDDGKVV